MKLKLEEWRVRNGLSQSDVAKVAEVNPATIWKWEHGTAQPRMHNLSRITQHYSIPMSELVELDDEPPKLEKVFTPIQSSDIMPDCFVKDSAHPDKMILLTKAHTETTFERIMKNLPSLSDSDLDIIWGIMERLIRGKSYVSTQKER